MGTISDSFGEAYRNFNIDGVPSSGDYEPDKSDIRAIGPVIEAAIANMGLGTMVGVTYATRSALNADLAHDAGTIGLVYADSTDANNDLYVKVGASGAGSWTLTTILHDVIETAAASYVADAAASADDAEAAALTATSAANTAALKTNRRLLLESQMAAGSLPQGFVDPDTYGITGYENAYNVRFYSTGTSVWPMIDVTTARAEWLEGEITVRDGTTTYVSVSVPKMNDFARQGAAVGTYYVDPFNGNDSAAGTSPATAWKTCTKARASAVRPAVVRVLADWIGNNGFTLATYTNSDSLKFIGVPKTAGRTKTLLTQMRESLTQASFAWSDNSDGSWTSVASLPSGVRNTPIGFDLLRLDLDGLPLPLKNVASKALARSTPNSWNYDVTDGLTVHLIGGEKPNPGVNWAYAEVGAALIERIADAKGIVYEDFQFIRNDGAAPSAGIRFQADGITVPGPRVEHTGSGWLINCDVVGASGNAVQFYDIARGGADGLRAKHCRDDRINVHTFYTYANVNTGDRTLEGRHIHIWDFGGVGESLGNTGFPNQPALSNSSNVVTSHDQCRITSLNVRGGDTNGCPVAIVSGAKGLVINPYVHDPLHTGAADNPRALNWCDGVSAAGVTATLDIMFGGGRADSTAVALASTGGGIIRHSKQRGSLTTLITGGGSITDVTPAGL